MTLCTATTEQVDRIKHLCANETLWLDNINTVWVSDNYDLIMALAARHRIGVCFADIYSWMENLAAAHDNALRGAVHSALSSTDADTIINTLTQRRPPALDPRLKERINTAEKHIIADLTAWLDNRATAMINAQYNENSTIANEKLIADNLNAYDFVPTRKHLREHVNVGVRRYNYLRASSMLSAAELCDTQNEKEYIVGDIRIWEKQQREGEKYVTTTNVEIAVTETMKLCRDMTANDCVREMIYRVLTWLAAEDIRKIHKYFKK